VHQHAVHVLVDHLRHIRLAQLGSVLEQRAQCTTLLEHAVMRIIAVDGRSEGYLPLRRAVLGITRCLGMLEKKPVRLVRAAEHGSSPIDSVSVSDSDAVMHACMHVTIAGLSHIIWMMESTVPHTEQTTTHRMCTRRASSASKRSPQVGHWNGCAFSWCFSSCARVTNAGCSGPRGHSVHTQGRGGSTEAGRGGCPKHWMNTERLACWKASPPAWLSLIASYIVSPSHLSNAGVAPRSNSS
jgi:hypothetical protein